MQKYFSVLTESKNIVKYNISISNKAQEEIIEILSTLDEKEENILNYFVVLVLFNQLNSSTLLEISDELKKCDKEIISVSLNKICSLMDFTVKSEIQVSQYMLLVSKINEVEDMCIELGMDEYMINSIRNKKNKLLNDINEYEKRRIIIEDIFAYLNINEEEIKLRKNDSCL